MTTPRRSQYGYPPGGDYRLPERERALRHPSDDETPDDPEPRPPRLRNPPAQWLGLNFGQWVILVSVVAGGGAVWGEMKAAAQQASKRLDIIEAKEVEIRKSYETLNDKLKDIQGDLKASAVKDAERDRTLLRIERLLDGRRNGLGTP